MVVIVSRITKGGGRAGQEELLAAIDLAVVLPRW